MEVAWTLFAAILGVGFPLYNPYISLTYSLYRCELATKLGMPWHFQLHFSVGKPSSLLSSGCTRMSQDDSKWLGSMGYFTYL